MKKFICIILSIMLLFCFSGCLNKSTFSATPTPANNGAALYTPGDLTPTPKQEGTNTPSEKATAKPIEKTTATPTKEPNAIAKPTATLPPSEPMVWIPTNGGKKYHSKSSCSSMKNPQQVTKSNAISQGFSPCGKCY